MASRGPVCFAALAAPFLAIRLAGAAPAGDPPPASLAVQVLAGEGVSEAERRLLTEAAVTAARGGGRWQLPPGDPTGAAAVRGRSDKALARSDKSLAEAKLRIKNLEEGALDLLDWAADEYARYLPDLLARDGNPRRLVEVYAQKTIVHHLDGEPQEAAAALRHCFVLEPDLDYDPKVFPPQLEQFVMQERLLFDELGTGKLEVAGPAGITVWINGVQRGVTPLHADQLRAGPNFVTLAIPGLDPVTVTVAIDGGHKSKVDVTSVLAPARLEGPLAKATGEVGRPSAGPGLRKAAAALGVDGLLLVRPAPRGGKLALVATVYDMRSGARVGTGEVTAERAGAPAAVAELVRTTLAAARWKASAEVSGPGLWSRMRGRWDGARRSKYFWPAVGVTAGVLVIGVWAATAGMSSGERVALFPVLTF